jgi:hypothetical protein
MAETINKINTSNKLLKIEDDFLEFKSRQYLTGENKGIVEKLAADLQKKLQRSKNKIYLFGISPNTKQIELVAFNKFSDDRLNEIKNKIKQKTNIKIEFAKVPVKDNLGLILGFIVD